MASELFDKWLAHYDTIHRGYTPRGIANGVTATGGVSFPRVPGGYNLYRGIGGAESIDFDHPVGAAGRGATAIANFGWCPHAGGTVYAYAVKSIGGGGVESAASWPAAVAEFDVYGSLLGVRSNGPTDLSVQPASGGAFMLRWVYASRYEEAEPASFQVFHDSGTGTVDYTTVVGQVGYVRGRAHFSYGSSGFSHGVRVIWGVRAVTAGGVADGGVLEAFGWADASAPAAHPGLRLSRLGEEEEAVV